MSREDYLKLAQQRKAMYYEKYRKQRERDEAFLNPNQDPDQLHENLRKARKGQIIEANHKDCGENVEERRTCLTTKRSIGSRKGKEVEFYNFELHNIE